MKLDILNPRKAQRGAGTITLGKCPLCGRNLLLSRANKTGARCTYEGAQFDTNGKFLYSPASFIPPKEGESTPCAYCGKKTAPKDQAAAPWVWPKRGFVTNCKKCAGVK